MPPSPPLLTPDLKIKGDSSGIVLEVSPENQSESVEGQVTQIHQERWGVGAATGRLRCDLAI